MLESQLSLLRCPVTRSTLRLQVIKKSVRSFRGEELPFIEEGILFAAGDWFYPIIGGIPRLLVEAFIDYADFCKKHLPDYDKRSAQLHQQYNRLIRYATRKNRRTKQSFSLEWSFFDYEHTKTWDAPKDAMLARFLEETAETAESLRGKWIFDAGCGNGLLNQLMAESGAQVVAMDLSNGVERAYAQNQYPSVLYIQGDLQFPPVAFAQFDIVQCSGVLICTNNTELSFSCLEPCVKPGGKYSVWLYHPRKDAIHNLFNFIRRYTSRLPLRLQYYLLLVTIFPLSYIIKRIKGNKQTVREMIIYILDWFTPEFRWEHEPTEASAWFNKRRYTSVQVTTVELFGFNITGVKDHAS